jgi:DNA polymerase elongation subunit (family B)
LPRIAYIDIETAPIIMAAWTMFEANAVWVERQTYILSFAVRWSDQKKTKTYTLPDYPRFKRNKHDDKDLCKDLFKVLDEADIIVAHNGDNFDLKKINSRLVSHGFKPPKPYRTIDTLKFARRTFKFDSNKLDNLGCYLGVGRKLPHTGADLWRNCVDGDERSWKLMRRYNAQDVDLLVAVYDRLKAWAPNHPDLRVWDDRAGCPCCPSTNVQRRGFNIAKTRKTERFQCSDCGAWFTGKTIRKGS